MHRPTLPVLWLAPLGVALFLAGCGGIVIDDPEGEPAHPGASCPSSSSGIEVLETREAGALPLPPGVRTASGGATGLVGGRVLWALAQVELDPPAADGTTVVTAMAGWSKPSRPPAPAYAASPAGSFESLLPQTAAEQAHGDAHPGEELVVWPMGIVEQLPDVGIVFYERLILRPGFLDMSSLGSGTALVNTGSSVALRPETDTFPGGAPFGLSPIVEEGTLYAYGCAEGGCRIARARLDAALLPGAWQTFDGATWTHDLLAGAPLFDGAPGDLSVAFHPHLDAYVAVHTEAFTDRVVARISPHPWGPWGAPTLLFRSATEGDYAGKEHVAFAGDCGREMLVSYYTPGSGELRLVEVRLR